MNFNFIRPKITTIINNNMITFDKKLNEICKLLTDNIFYYNWVGFYFANHQTQSLHLKTYVGLKTNHTVIPFGKGICGQVAISNKNFIVPNVNEQENYIACNLTVKSEIVVPIFVNGVNIGQIDIDSNVLNPFTTADERFLEFICQQISNIYELENTLKV